MLLIMRFLSVPFILSGVYLLVYDFLPIAAQWPWISHYPASWQRIAGLIVVVVGLLLRLRSRAAGDDISDQPIRAELQKRGFRFIALDKGWQADGAWNQVSVSVRRQSDYQASRFGRPWVIVVLVPGQAREPWPFPPEQGKIVESRPEGFSVVIVDCSYDGKQGVFAQRMDQILAQRRA